MARKNKIYWLTPTTALLSFTAGLSLSLGHHLTYRHLAGSVAPPGEYHTLVGKISKQQLNIAIGTAFAYLVKSTLSLAVATSYAQVFWRALVTASKGARLRDIDSAYSVTQDILKLFNVGVWRRNPLLLPLALIIWLIPIPSIFTPGTLTIQSALVHPSPSSMTVVPQMDFLNLNFVSMLGEDPAFTYAGAAQLVQRIAAATATQGEILPIQPPALNASWSLQFWGPAIQCNNVSETQRTTILNSYVSYVESPSSWILPPSYISWGIQNSTEAIPFNNTTGTLELSQYGWYDYGFVTMFVAYIGDYDIIPWTVMQEHFSTSSIQAFGGWPQILRNLSAIECNLYNSSYAVQFEYTNGAQNVTISRPDTSQDVLFTAAQADFNLPMGANETWDGFDQSSMLAASYQAIFDAFTQLIYGIIYSQTEQSDSFITQTILTETEDLEFLYTQLAIQNTVGDSPAFQMRSMEPLLGSRGPLIDALERLFENFTISLLSDPYLQPNYSLPNAPSPYVNVTYDVYDNIYVYDSVVLWIAYGLAIFLTGLSIVIGFAAMRSNGVAYDTNFSTVLRATHIQQQSDAISGHKERPQMWIQGQDDGSRPLPKSLEDAFVIMRASPNERLLETSLLQFSSDGHVSSQRNSRRTLSLATSTFDPLLDRSEDNIGNLDENVTSPRSAAQ